MKELTDKQLKALDLLTCGLGLSYKAICEEIEIDVKTLWRWRHEPEFAHFQDALQKINDERWAATVDAARKAAFELCQDKNPKIVEFILKNEGYNPTTKIDAEISQDVVINIGE